MKKYCKNIDITDLTFIQEAIFNCLKGKKKRRDVQELFNKYKTVENIAKIMSNEIQSRKLFLKPIWYSDKIDPSSKKNRRVGIQDIKQQLYDYVAVQGLKPFFVRIGEYQCAAIPGRGQDYGRKAILKWVNNEKKQYACKLDITKCYESIDKDKLINFLKKHIKNDNLIWLISELIKTFDKGLSIGSYLSQYLCNLYLSELYHFISEKLYIDSNEKKERLISHVLFYMDDILIIGTNFKYLKKAINKILEKGSNMGFIIKKETNIFQIAFSKYSPGTFIDMMGYRFYKKYVTIRRRIFRRLRRTFLRAWRKIKKIPINMAQRCIAYFGFIKYTNNYILYKKYHVFLIIKKSKEVISNASKISKAIVAS